jgi:uncharacterized protein YbbK (DUF523 family)
VTDAGKALVSACLVGRACRYDGRANTDRMLERELAAAGLAAVPFCPEEHGGLGTPRPPAWIERESAAAVLAGRDRVVTDSGVDVAHAFVRGAEGALDLCRAHGITRAFLKARSPSCGSCQTHVANRLVEGRGVTAELLARNGSRSSRSRDGASRARRRHSDRAPRDLLVRPAKRFARGVLGSSASQARSPAVPPSSLAKRRCSLRPTSPLRPRTTRGTASA